MQTATLDDDDLGFRSYGGEAELHCHDFHQIVLPRLGALELEIDGRGGAVTRGRGAFITAGSRHAFRASGRNGFVVVDTRNAAIDEAAIARFSRSGFFDIRLPVQGLLDYLPAGPEISTIAGPLRTHWCGLLYAALTRPASREGGPSCRALERALGFMRAELHRPLSIDEIAREAGISATRLHGLFRAQHGMTPHAMLIEMRLDAALALLADTALSVAEIAVRTGHGDQSGLTRRLRQSRGMTPARFRKAQAPAAVSA